MAQQTGTPAMGRLQSQSRDASAAALQLQIPVAPLLEDFLCPICFEMITAATMAPCSHNFCEGCISEWCTRSTHCPVCSATVSATTLVKNLFVDNTLQALRTAEEAARKAYLDKLSAGVEVDPSPTSPATPADTTLSPIEQLFRSHMQRALASYRYYLTELQNKVLVKKQKAELELQDAIAKARGAHAAKSRVLDSDVAPAHPTLSRATSESDLEAAIAAATAKRDETFASLQKQLDTATALLLQSYDAYMKAAAPDPAMIPATVTLRVKGIHAMDMLCQIRPTMFIRDLYQHVHDRASQLGDPVRTFGEGNKWVLRSDLVAAEDRKDGTAAEYFEFTDESMPLVMAVPGRVIPQGSIIELLLPVMYQSQTPKSCFTAEFREGAGQAVDYFTCKNCGMNWICPSCAECCHTSKGHTVVPYLSAHVPSYACCYCPKKKKCTLPNGRQNA